LVGGARFGPKPQRHWTQLSIFNTLRAPHRDVPDRQVRLMQDRGIRKKPAGG
jgi:hypothetical protein